MSLAGQHNTQAVRRAEFSTLPSEIRTQIYEYCLCVERDLVPYPEPFNPQYESDHKGPKPSVALLVLNRKFRNEALPILFGKNSWRVTSEPAGLEISDGRLLRFVKMDNNYNVIGVNDPTRQSFWTRFGSFINHAVFRYSHLDIDTEIATGYRRKMHNSLKFPLQHDKVREIHGLDQQNVICKWLTMRFAFSELRNLKTLKIHIDDLFCPTGCCRDWPLNVFLIYRSVPIHTKVHIYGVLNHQEAESLRQAISQDKDVEKHGTFPNYTIHEAS